MIRTRDTTLNAVRPLPADVAQGSWVRGPLEWHRIRWGGSEWELLASGRRLCTLSMRRGPLSRAIASGPSGEWEIRRRWMGAAEIAPAGGAAVVSYRPGWWSGGVLETMSGFHYTWARVGFWRPEYQILNDSGFPCVRFRPDAWGPRSRCTVVVEAAGERLAELEAMVLLGWRLLVAARSHAH